MSIPSTGDPLLKGADWLAVRSYWQRVRGPCGRCGREIDYVTTPRYWKSLDVGHIVSRDDARRMGWTQAQINALSNTRPEHQKCSRQAGATQGNRKRRGLTLVRRVPVRPAEAAEW